MDNLKLTAIGVIAVIVIGFIIIMGIILLIAKIYRKVEQGKAMIVNTMRSRPTVTFTGKMVLPVFHKVEVMDISLKRIVIDRNGNDGLICKDNIRADISVNFFIRVNPTEDDVLRVASNIGCDRASDQNTLNELWAAKFAEALKTVGKQMDFEGLYQEREQFRDSIKAVIGDDLNGYKLEDVAIDYLEQTPVDSLDAMNILDAQGIRKITELTAEQHVSANLARNEERKRIKKQDVEADEAVLELERQKADAQAKQRREIETTIAREEASTKVVVEEERLKSEQARIKADLQLAVENENKQREIEVAEQERLKIVGIKEEEVQKARQLEVVDREKEVDIRTIEKEKAVEVEKCEIANTIRERVAVEKTVAEEEEKIKEVREVSEADRAKQVKVLAAQAEAEETLVKDVKKAEAEEKSARFLAQKEIALAEADLEASAKKSEAMKVLADGEKARMAAEGLAKAQVMEAEAVANEKYGLAEAKVEYEKLAVAAKATEEQGVADAKATHEKGMAAAKVAEEQFRADAEGEKAKGLAIVAVQEAEAAAIEKRGRAEAIAIQEKLYAEAEGLTKKFAAINGLDEIGRAHEEFRMGLEKAQTVELEAIEAQKVLGREQAGVLAEAFKDANIQIVGGDGAFFDRFVQAVSLGKAIDATVGNSETIKTIGNDYLTGNKDLLADIKDVLSNPKASSDDVKNLVVSGALAKLMKGSKEEQTAALKKLGEAIKGLSE